MVNPTSYQFFCLFITLRMKSFNVFLECYLEFRRRREEVTALFTPLDFEKFVKLQDTSLATKVSLRLIAR